MSASRRLAAYAIALCTTAVATILGGGCAGPYAERRDEQVVRRFGEDLVTGTYVSPIAYEHYVLAMLFENAGRLEEATDELRRALGSDGTSAYLRWKLADALIGSGRIDEAREELSTALRIEPDSAEAYVVKSRLRARLGDHAGVEAALVQAIALDPKLEEAYLALAAAQRDAHEGERSLATMRALATRVPSATAEEALGRAALAQRDRKSAREHLTRAVEIDSARNEARLLLAHLAIGDGDVELGLHLLRGAAERTRDMTLLLDLAHNAALSGRVTQALAVLDRLEEEAVIPQARLLVAKGFVGAGVPARARRIAERVLFDARQPEVRSAAFEVLARAAEAQQEVPEALEAWQQIGPNDAEYTTAVIGRARLLRLRGHDTLAMGLIKEALIDRSARARLDEHDQLTSVLALLRAELGERELALAQLEIAAAARPTSSILQLTRAKLEQQAGRSARAIAILEPRARAGDLDAQHLLGDTLVASQQRVVDAIAVLERAESLAPHDATIADSLGVAYLEGGRTTDAQRLLERANRLAPGDPDVLGHIAKLYQALDLPTQAVAALKRAMQSHPSEAARRAMEGQLLMIERGRVGAR